MKKGRTAFYQFSPFHDFELLTYSEIQNQLNYSYTLPDWYILHSSLSRKLPNGAYSSKVLK